MPGHTNPILFDFPDQFETERLIIRAPRPGEGAVINIAIHESHAHLKPWMPWAVQLPLVDDTEEFVRRGAAQFILRENLPFLLWRKGDNHFVGGSGMHNIDWSVPAFEIGYWVRASLQGEGYITEAVNGIARFAFKTLGAERVEIRCDARNERSAAVARRAGFKQQAHFLSDSRAVDGNLRDTLVFARMRERPATT